MSRNYNLLLAVAAALVSTALIVPTTGAIAHGPATAAQAQVLVR